MDIPPGSVYAAHTLALFFFKSLLAYGFLDVLAKHLDIGNGGWLYIAANSHFWSPLRPRRFKLLTRILQPKRCFNHRSDFFCSHPPVLRMRLV
jgi:hypothetical protein